MSTFSPEVVTAVLEHMNGDHTDDNLLIVRAFADREALQATMIDLDGQGGRWRYTTPAGEQEADVAWSTEISTRPEIRREIVVLYNAACDELGVPRRDEH